MTFIGWIDFSAALISVNREENGFVCEKYSKGGNKVHGAEKHCSTKEELKDFLYSFPNPPVDIIEAFLQNPNL
jgi:hypothetical protein